ncbi:site-specific integrase [Fulvivirga sp. 29W222]|uniref:Site-specific integrase n=1 Tax=Fulvivirga marina TaxID=2494733 RepID=A0A937FUJ1_9BACT|nr:tyrosine-type recombinase/integrase [Fulvivirga marina]MBL6444717.1 site-specific integrase [Fulvivirga marina]
MATLALRLDTRNKKTNLFPVVIRLTHKGVPKRIPVGLRLRESEWDNKNKKIKNSYNNSTRTNKQLYNKLSIAEDVLTKYSFHLKDMTVYDLAEAITKEIAIDTEKKSPDPILVGRTTLLDYGSKVEMMYKKSQQYSWVKMCRYSVNKMLEYHGNNRLLITDIDEMYILGFEAECKSKNIQTSTIAIILRTIRRIYNLAVKDKSTEVTREHYPFGQGGYSIKKGSSKKRAVNDSYMQIIKDLSYPLKSKLWHARNYLLFMYYLRGMNFADLSYLTRDCLEAGRLRYQRRKTRRGTNVKEFNFSIPSEAQVILEYYLQQKRAGNLIFPVLDEVINHPDSEVIHKKYLYRLSGFNRSLGKIGKDAGLPIKLSSYVIRHTFAMAGKNKGVSKAIIGDMLGHTDYSTTEAYFSEFEQEVMDEAANVIFG